MIGAAVEAAARVWFERQMTGRLDAGRLNDDGEPWRWDQISEHDQNSYRALVRPIVEAALAVAGR